MQGQTWRYVPSTIGIVDRRSGVFHPRAEVLRVIAHNPGPHKGAVRSDLYALEIVTPFGSRWHGTAVQPRITSRLRMAFVPISNRDEVLATWDDASADVV